MNGKIKHAIKPRHYLSRKLLTNCQNRPAPLLYFYAQHQFYALSPLLSTNYICDCIPTHPTNTIIKFADNAMVVELFPGGDELDYRSEIKRLAAWISENNLALNTIKSKELVVDFQ